MRSCMSSQSQMSTFIANVFSYAYDYVQSNECWIFTGAQRFKIHPNATILLECTYFSDYIFKNFKTKHV